MQQRLLSEKQSLIVMPFSEKSKSLYWPYYKIAAAFVGIAISDSGWMEFDRRNDLLSPALSAYQSATKVCSSRGVIFQALDDLKLLLHEGIEDINAVVSELRQYYA